MPLDVLPRSFKRCSQELHVSVDVNPKPLNIISHIISSSTILYCTLYFYRPADDPVQLLYIVVISSFTSRDTCYPH